MKKVVVGIISKKDDSDQDTYLFVRSKRDFGDFTGYWYPPGGHIEKGESEKGALIREIKEELDINVLPVERIAETPGDIENQITYWWRCDLTGGEIKISDELSDAKFFTKEDMESISLWPATQDFFKKHVFSVLETRRL